MQPVQTKRALQEGKEPITDSNIYDARDMWFADRARAIETYGHISEWDVSEVTKMNRLFIGTAIFCCFRH